MKSSNFLIGHKKSGEQTQQASSFISLGVIGGAFSSYIMGKIADDDVATAHYLPILCYFVIFFFG